MRPDEAVRHVLGRYGELEGRARRAEFWWFALAHALAVAVPLTAGSTLLVVALVAEATGRDVGRVAGVAGTYLLVVGSGTALALLVPFCAVAARRLHDTDRSALWLLLVLAPYASPVLYWFWAEDGRAGPNRFGPDPKGRAPAPWSVPPSRGAGPRPGLSPWSVRPPLWSALRP